MDASIVVCRKVKYIRKFVILNMYLCPKGGEAHFAKVEYLSISL